MTEPYLGTRPVLALVCRPDDESATVTAAPGPGPAASAARLYIRTLGGLRIYRGERQLAMTWQSGKARELFCCIAAGAGRRLHRDELIRAVWGDAPVDRSRLNLFRMALGRMKNSFLQAGLPCPVAGSGEHFELDPNVVDIDILQFRDHALQGLKLLARSDDRAKALPHLENALDLYGGSFLTDEPGTGFVAATRQVYGQLYRTVRNRLEKLYLADQRFASLDMLRLIEACQAAFGGMPYRQASGQ
jgi:DNA-binding SARP family transcriptional activator